MIVLKETKWILNFKHVYLKFIEHFPDYLLALSRTLLRLFGQPLSKQLCNCASHQHGHAPWGDTVHVVSLRDNLHVYNLCLNISGETFRFWNSSFLSGGAFFSSLNNTNVMNMVKHFVLHFTRTVRVTSRFWERGKELLLHFSSTSK